MKMMTKKRTRLTFTSKTMSFKSRRLTKLRASYTIKKKLDDQVTSQSKPVGAIISTVV